MIPKVIHYCRFWWPKPQLVLDCIASWNFFCPDWTIIEWNENNCDLKINKRVNWAAKKKKRAFVADYFRLKALYEQWGIYIDTDVKMLKNIDVLLKSKAIIWFQKRNELCTWFIWSDRHNLFIKDILKYYETHYFIPKTINEIITEYFVGKWLVLNGKTQNVVDWKILPSHYVSIDINDWNAFVEDFHMNSWVPIKTNNKPAIYLENLASQDDTFALYFDEYMNNIYATNQRKIWNAIINVLKFFRIDLLYLFIIKYRK